MGGRELVKIPTRLEEIKIDWLNEALAESETFPRHEIVSIDRTTLSGGGQGFLGQTCRLHLTYRSGSAHTPETIVVKISHHDSEFLKNVSSFFRREVFFYTKISQRSSIRSPLCYYGDFDENTGNSVLLLEDLGGGQIGDMISGGSVEASITALNELVRLHVAWWDREELDDLEWIPQMPKLEDPQSKQQLLDIYAVGWTLFSEKFGDAIPRQVQETWEVFTQEFDKIRDLSIAPPLTLCHGDYHLENMAFSETSEHCKVTVFDWQCLRVSQGPLDLCYFLVYNLDPHLRRKHEADFIHLYVNKLLEADITDYSLDQCQHAYKVALYELLLTRTVMAGGHLDTSNERAQTLFQAILHRVDEAISDHPLQELI